MLEDIYNNQHILLIDGNSYDKTVEVAKNFGAKILYQKGKGKGIALFQGLEHTGFYANYIVLIDADYTYPAKYIPPKNLSKDGYPLTLQSGSILYHFGTGSRSSRASRLKKFSPKAFVEINEVDAESLGISHGDAVKVISPAGEVTTTARVTDTLPPGMLFMPNSFPESPVNALFGVVLDPRAKNPALKACAVRLERINSSG